MGIVNATGGARQQKSSSCLPCHWEQISRCMNKFTKGRRLGRVILIKESVWFVLLVFFYLPKGGPLLCDRIEAARSQGADAVHWGRPGALVYPQWSDYHVSCHHTLATTNVSSRSYSAPPPLRPCVANPSPSRGEKGNTHIPIDFFLVYIFTHTHTRAIRSTFIDGPGAPLGGRPAVQPTPINLPIRRLPTGKTDEPCATKN